MVVVVLRVQGSGIESEHLSWLPRERIQRSWKKGESRGGLSVNRESGFSVLLSEDEDPGQATAAAGVALAELVSPIAQLVAGGARGEVDWGIMIESGAITLQSIRLTPEMLRLVEQCGLDAVVSVYPCSE